MGIVYLVEDLLKDNQRIALKKIRVTPSDDRDSLGNKLTTFKQEFIIMTRLKHPNLIRVFDFFTDEKDGYHFLTMDYLEGKSISELLQKNKAIPLDVSLDIIVMICRALNFIHTRKILHRDINPNNLFYNDNTIKIMDFGLSDLDESEAVTKGTLPYIAPEVITSNVDNQVDIFALGATFFEMITGEKLHTDTRAQSIVNALTDRHQFSDLLKKRLTIIKKHEVRDIIEKMLAFEKSQRYKSCSNIINDINKKLGTSYTIETDHTRQAYVLGSGFVGRKMELKKMSEWLNRTQARLFLVKGAAGIGKSRLFLEFKHFCQLQEFIFIESNSLEDIHHFFAAFLPILNNTLFLAPDALVNKYGPELKKVLSNHKRLVNINVSQNYIPEKEYTVLKDTIKNYILDFSLCQIVPVVLYFNDFQWADEASVEILDELLHVLSRKQEHNNEVPLHIYISSREVGCENLDNFIENSQTEGFTLQPFNNEQVIEYFEKVFGENKIGNRLKKSIPAILKMIGGNPFYLQELMRSLIENRSLIRNNETWELANNFEDISIPDKLDDIITQRIRRLNFNEAERRIVNVLSLMDRGITLKELHQIIPTTLSFLTYLERIEIVKTTVSGNSILYQLAHDLIKQAITDRVDTDEKLELHHTIAQRLESIHEKNLEAYIDELVYHFCKTDDYAKKRQYLEIAADRASAKFDNEKSVALYKRLYDLLEEDEYVFKSEIGIKVCRIYFDIFKIDRGKIFAVQLLKDANKSGEKKLIGLANYFNGYFYRIIPGVEDNSETYFLKAISIFEEIKDYENLVIAYDKFAFYYFNFRHDLTNSLKYAHKALKIAEKMENKYLYAMTIGNMSMNFFEIGDYQKAIFYNKKAIIIAEAMDLKRPLTVGYHCMSLYYMLSGDYETALKYMDKSYYLSNKINCMPYVCETLIGLSQIMFKLGLLQKALSHVEMCITAVNEENYERLFFFAPLLAKRIKALLQVNGLSIYRKYLKDLLRDDLPELDRAYVTFELWNLTKKPSYRSESLELFEKVYPKTSQIELKYFINLLKTNQTYLSSFSGINESDQ